MCHHAIESLSILGQKYEANFNGNEHLLHCAKVDHIIFSFMLVPREELFEIMIADEDKEIEVECMSFDGVSVGYIDEYGLTSEIIFPEVKGLYKYLAMRCPFASLENRFKPSPLNKLTIEGKEYNPSTLRGIYCLYAVEQEKLKPGISVLISNSQYGNGTGVIQEQWAGDLISDGFVANFQVLNVQIQ